MVNFSGIEADNSVYFGKEALNRVSFLRENSSFINNAVNHSSTRFLFFKNTEPLVIKDWDDKLVLLTNGDNILTNKISKGIKNLPSWNKTIEKWCESNETHHHELRDNQQPTILFLGIEDESVGIDLSNVDHLNHENRYKGIPYFAVDLTDSPDLTNDILKFLSDNSGIEVDNHIFFSTSRKHHLGFNNTEASIFSHGKMYLDWLNRNRFCPGCGSKVIPIHAGGKIQCTNDKVLSVDETSGKKKYECPVKNTSVSNVSFPRTDAVVITAITNSDRSKILLSLNRRHAMTNMYTCTSGFMEPSETVEVATKREIWEEVGVVCSKINLVSTQPWPFPGNLMIGCIAEVDFNGVNEIIDLGHDNEIKDARWFDTKFVKNLVYDDGNNVENNPEGILIPMGESIAYQLIKMVVDQADKSKL
ncbi:NAD-capped RNA hydrolase Npy1p [[Candida] jaroonii]|uniref:NAD-capped RNA hydrolase Npy1p n=1 Tax=[Candida] jaroonii TaxID=467808 RepID=A0ACA9Y5C0_9ASCO|nr:NAD-capped RNA hydrolase Npy1p [[Candida] jaroonii]